MNTASPAPCPQRSQQRGFTLIEIMVVMVIIAMLAALIGPRVMNALSGSKVKASRIQIENLANAIDTFHLDVGRYPSQAEGLQVLIINPTDKPITNWRGPYLKKIKVPNDEWGNTFIYTVPSTRPGVPYELMSLGADGKPGGTGDDADLGSWE
jgi:general secretion pathway protein G